MLALSAKTDAALAEDVARAEAAAESGGVNVRRSTRAVKNRVIMVRGLKLRDHMSLCLKS